MLSLKARQDLQAAYNRGTGTPPTVVLDGTRNGVVIRDGGATGTLFGVQDASSNNVLDVQTGRVDIGRSGRRLWSFQDTDGTGYPTSEYMPDGGTRTTATGGSMLSWSSTVTANIPGGGGLGNDTAPSAIAWNGETIFADQGFLFATQLLVNAAATLTAQAALGPVYLFLDQYTTRADGVSTTCSQHNALRIQPSWGPNINGGSITQTSAVYILNNATVDATVGSAAITELTYWQANSPTLTAGGTIGTFRGLEFADISGPSTIFGIDSAMSNGTFINHTGTAPSNFAGSVRVNNGVNLTLGTDGGNRIQLLRSAAGVMRMIGAGGANNEGLDWNFQGVANEVSITSTTGAGLRIGTGEVSVGTSAPSGGNNWNFIFSPGAKTTSLAGDFARVLFTASANVTINAALTTFTSFTVNSPAGVLGSGSVTNAANLLIQTAPGVGTNRYGLLITSNPSGGTLNYAFRQSNASARARFDGRLDINRGIALGGGAGATLGTIGGSGPTAAAQAQWVEIDVNGVAHWIPAWT